MSVIFISVITESRQHSSVFLFFQMGEDQSLPVPVQHILTAGGKKLHSASLLPWFQKKVNFRIMAQRLEMADTLHGTADRLFVYNIPAPNSTHSPKRSWIRLFKISICTSPMTCAWISARRSFQTMWSSGISSSNWRSFPSI